MTDKELNDLTDRAKQAAQMLWDGRTGNPEVIYELLNKLKETMKERDWLIENLYNHKVSMFFGGQVMDDYQDCYVDKGIIR